MKGFRSRGGDLLAEVDPAEGQALAEVVADVVELLGGRLPGDDRGTDPDGGALGDGAAPVDGLSLSLLPLPTPDDPAVHRLLPDASRDDPQVAAEFRRLTEDDLRRVKTDRLVWLHGLLTEPVTRRAVPVRIARTDGPRLAAALTDVRLVLAERLGVQDDESSHRLEQELVAGPPQGRAAQARHYLGAVHLTLGWWQETLMHCLLRDLDRA